MRFRDRLRFAWKDINWKLPDHFILRLAQRLPFPPVKNSSETMRILVLSREVAALRGLWSLVESNGWRLETANSGWEIMERVQSGLAPHLLIVDVPRKDGDSLHVLRWVRRFRPDLPILVLIHAEDAHKKNDAMRIGADDVLIRPFSDDELKCVIGGYLHYFERPSRTSGGRVEVVEDDFAFVGNSPAMRKLREQAELLAQTDVPVLIVGERGTGKDTVARLIHRLSVRSGFRFQKIQCASLPLSLSHGEVSGHSEVDSIEALFELPGRGVLFLNEITQMPTALQQQLLKALEVLHDRPESEQMLGRYVRLLVSSSVNIERALAERKLREDLYYRLSSFTVHVPPLRQRNEDIRPLLSNFMHRIATHYGLGEREFSQSVIERCENYSWPGNLTELEAFVKRYLVAGESDALFGKSGEARAAMTLDIVQTTDVQRLEDPSATPLKSLIQSLKSETEKNAIAVALDKTGWNRKAAARLLGVSYRTLLYKIEQYKMSEEQSAASAAQHALTVDGSKEKAG